MASPSDPISQRDGARLDYIAHVRGYTPPRDLAYAGRTSFLSIALIGTALVGLAAYWFTCQSYLTPPRSLSWRLFIKEEGSPALLVALISVLAFVFPLRAIAPARVASWVSAIGRAQLPIAICFGLVAALLSILVYQATPLSMDEYTAFFQAKVFAEGEWFARFPTDLVDRLIPPAFIDNFFSVSEGRVIQVFWPGFAALLTPFMKMGAPWMLNPLLAFGSLLLMSRIARLVLGDDEVVGWCLLFAIACPVLLANSLSFYSLNARLFFNLLFAYFLLKKDGRHSTVLAGIAGSLALVAHNPFSHLVFALPWWISLCASSEGRRRIGSLAAGYAPITLLVGGGWALLLGDFESVVPGVKHYWDLHTLATVNPFRIGDGWALRTINAARTVLWAMPGIAALALLGWNKTRGPLRLFGWSLVFSVVAYAFAANRLDQGLGWGYRYMFAAFPAFPLLAAAGMKRGGRAVGSHAIWLAVAVLSIGISGASRVLQIVEHVSSHRAQFACLEASVEHVCIIAPRLDTIASDLVQNDPFLRGRRLIFMGRGLEDDVRFMKERFPMYEPSFDWRDGSIWRPLPTKKASR